MNMNLSSKIQQLQHQQPHTLSKSTQHLLTTLSTIIKKESSAKNNQDSNVHTQTSEAQRLKHVRQFSETSQILDEYNGVLDNQDSVATKHLIPNKPNGEMDQIAKNRLLLAKTNQETLRLEKQQKGEANKENNSRGLSNMNKRVEHPEKSVVEKCKETMKKRKILL